MSSILLAYTDADGWRLGIGDPTIMGWLTVAAYLGAAILAGNASRTGSTGQRRFWLALAVMLFALGVNKQLDLQTWFTLTAKRIAQAQGWYEQRRFVQFAFIVLIGIGSLAAAWLGLRVVTRNGPKLWLPLTGFCLLLCFVIIRAASFHHVDQFLRFQLAGVKMNWLFELTGIAMVAAGAIWQRFPGFPPAARSASRPARAA